MYADGGELMNANVIRDAIPYETAIMLCKEFRAEAEWEWHTAASRWCWRCQQAAGGEASKRGFLRAPGNRGCILVNARYAEMQAEGRNLDRT
jgi:hypothetical protein